jgi:hypothetical protein
MNTTNEAIAQNNKSETNRLIAEFMGAKIEIWEEVNQPYYKGTNHKGWSCGSSDRQRVEENVYNSCNFQNDWNLLMEVVEKIESLDFRFEMLSQKSNQKEGLMYCNIEIGSTSYSGADITIDSYGGKTNKIEAFYNGCVEFIKWYNEQNK